MNDGGPAFPISLNVLVESEALRSGALTTDELARIKRGMSLRDWFAGRAMEALIVHHGIYWQGSNRDNLAGFECKEAAEFAYQFADAMLSEREKGGK